MALSLSFLSANQRRISLLLVVGITGFASGCIMSRESSFFKNFSMRDLVTSNKAIKGFHCDPAGGGGGGGGGIGSWAGGFGGGGSRFHSQKSDGFACRLSSNELQGPDEERLITSLKQQLEDSLRSYGARIRETGSSDTHSFYFSYDIKDIQGRIQVSGQRIGVDFYSLQASLEESK
jgi:hypothetical protein